MEGIYISSCKIEINVILWMEKNIILTIVNIREIYCLGSWFWTFFKLIYVIEEV